VRAPEEAREPVGGPTWLDGEVGELPDLVLAIDGGKQEYPVQNGFPGAELCCITIAGVVLDIRRMRELESERPVDPRRFKSLESASSLERFFPGCNVVLAEEQSAEGSLRRTLFEAMQGVKVMGEEGESLLDTYETLLDYKSQDARQRCPYMEDCPGTQAPYVFTHGQSTCGCAEHRGWYSTDALRIHEGMAPGGSNLALFEEVLQVLERLWLVHVLRGIERNGWLRVMRRMAFVMDGPLAIFGHPAWLSEAIYRELGRINELAKSANNGLDMLILGVEKSGTFAQHLELLDQEASGGHGRIPAGSLFLLGDSYIKRNIIFSTSERPYGQQVYFGRKFFYKTTSGALLVANLPFLNEGHRDLNVFTPDRFPRLNDAVALMERLWSARFPNALIPLISAHAEAAIPMNLGRRVIEDLVRDLVRQDEGRA
jgi:hypothetical protein